MKSALKGQASDKTIRDFAKKLRNGAKKLSGARRGRRVQCGSQVFWVAPISGTTWDVAFDVDEGSSVIRVMDFHPSGVVTSETNEPDDEAEDVST
ncbi:hypothetical protein [Xanthomonas hortorum]|uniref:hypothetical protein n=1 Tax=Xanthomonas hortorum TaxID=56454 RepID=UPI001593EEDD|nr:hypothetical protein [Xanthomonas hortorum]NHF67178.1 hypothetical protein [Xanthomonas hortorum]